MSFFRRVGQFLANRTAAQWIRTTAQVIQIAGAVLAVFHPIPGVVVAVIGIALEEASDILAEVLAQRAPVAAYG